MASSGIERNVAEGVDLLAKRDIIVLITNELELSGITEYQVIDEGSYIFVTAVHVSRKKLKEFNTFLDSFEQK